MVLQVFLQVDFAYLLDAAYFRILYTVPPVRPKTSGWYMSSAGSGESDTRREWWCGTGTSPRVSRGPLVEVEPYLVVVDVSGVAELTVVPGVPAVPVLSVSLVLVPLARRAV